MPAPAEMTAHPSARINRCPVLPRALFLKPRALRIADGRYRRLGTPALFHQI